MYIHHVMNYDVIVRSYVRDCQIICALVFTLYQVIQYIMFYLN
jgi:hypothetical protein